MKLLLTFLSLIVLTTHIDAQTHFTYKSNTGNNASIGIPLSANPNVNGQPLAAGDEIGVFTPDGLCVGAVVWNGEKNVAFAVWGNDSMTDEIDGLQPGEEMHFRVWRQSTGREYDQITLEYSEGNGVYAVNGIYVVSKLNAVYGDGPSNKISVVTVEASGHDGNLPENTLDGNLDTRWSSEGNEEWIKYDLEKYQNIELLNIAWFRGDKRKAYYTIQVSADGNEWVDVFSGESSGQTIQPEPHTFDSVEGRYVRIIGNGNSSNDWNSVTVVEIWGDDVTSVDGDGSSNQYLPEEYNLEQNYPNPFNPVTTIQYTLPHESFVRIDVYNAIGQKVATLIEEIQSTGSHQIQWAATNVPSGMYFYRLEALPLGGKVNVYSKTRRMILMK